MVIGKYVKALVETTTKEHLEAIYSKLVPLSELAKNEKYNLVITSPMVSDEKKVQFLVELLEVKDEKIINLFKLMTKNKRLKQLPKLVVLLKDIIAKITGNYEGVVYSKESLSETKMAQIESKLSQKTGKNIKLKQKKGEKNGVQVYVDSLNTEIAIYEDEIKAKLIENVLKAI